jgi:F-type H+-transporting ATPase subunit epsilon
MAKTIQLKVATAERLLVNSEVTAAECPCSTGYIGILPGHAPFVGVLGTGTLTYTPPAGNGKSIKLSGGFIQIADNCVRVLADSAENS